MKNTRIYFDESANITDEMYDIVHRISHPNCNCKLHIRRRARIQAWLNRHRLAMWLLLDFILLVGFYFMLNHIWDFTTPLVKLMKGQI